MVKLDEDNAHNGSAGGMDVMIDVPDISGGDAESPRPKHAQRKHPHVQKTADSNRRKSRSGLPPQPSVMLEEDEQVESPSGEEDGDDEQEEDEQGASQAEDESSEEDEPQPSVSVNNSLTNGKHNHSQNREKLRAVLSSMCKKCLKRDKGHPFVPPKGSDISVEKMQRTWQKLAGQIGSGGIPCRPSHKDVQKVLFYMVGLTKEMKMTLFYPEQPDKEFHNPTEVLKAIYAQHGIECKTVKGWDQCFMYAMQKGTLAWRKFSDMIPPPYRNTRRRNAPASSSSSSSAANSASSSQSATPKTSKKRSRSSEEPAESPLPVLRQPAKKSKPSISESKKRQQSDDDDSDNDAHSADEESDGEHEQTSAAVSKTPPSKKKKATEVTSNGHLQRSSTSASVQKAHPVDSSKSESKGRSARGQQTGSKPAASKGQGLVKGSPASGNSKSMPPSRSSAGSNTQMDVSLMRVRAVAYVLRADVRTLQQILSFQTRRRGNATAQPNVKEDENTPPVVDDQVAKIHSNQESDESTVSETRSSRKDDSVNTAVQNGHRAGQDVTPKDITAATAVCNPFIDTGSMMLDDVNELASETATSSNASVAAAPSSKTPATETSSGTQSKAAEVAQQSRVDSGDLVESDNLV